MGGKDTRTGYERLFDSTFNTKKTIFAPPPNAIAVNPNTPIQAGDVGTTRPLGIYDPLNLMTQEEPKRTPAQKYRRWQEMEIKHGRIAMAATVHVLVTEAGGRWGGYLSKLSFPPLKFEDIPGGTWGSWEAIPQLGWFQIVCLVAIIDNTVFKQFPDREPGDVAPDWLPWVRYSDPGTKKFKLNSERNNGRAAMMGIFGMMTNEALTGNPLYPLVTPAMAAAGMEA
jgi:light-harvesting complex I chlorophyll a/b binding protein 1